MCIQQILWKMYKLGEGRKKRYLPMSMEEKKELGSVQMGGEIGEWHQISLVQGIIHPSI